MIALDATGAGEPLVLLHGLGASRAVWNRVTPALAADRLVLAPDLPGFGESAPAGPGFDLERTARKLGVELANRAGRPFDLVGNSLGGAVALHLAILRPDLVRRLVLSAPGGFSPSRWPLPLAAGKVLGPMMMASRVLGPPLAVSPTARRALLARAIAEPERLSADDARTMLRGSRGSTRIGPAIEAVMRADLGPLLQRLERPLGAIWGRQDRVVPIGTLERIRAVRPEVVVEILENAAHVPQLECPEEYPAALERIFDRLTAQ